MERKGVYFFLPFTGDTINCIRALADETIYEK